MSLSLSVSGSLTHTIIRPTNNLVSWVISSMRQAWHKKDECHCGGRVNLPPFLLFSRPNNARENVESLERCPDPDRVTSARARNDGSWEPQANVLMAANTRKCGTFSMPIPSAGYIPRISFAAPILGAFDSCPGPSTCGVLFPINTK